ncbi:MAG: hypothetical protein M1831_002409 [Alyxoria varia]|nr:MAG: hypothetical protein M1831_002409 [Alyxoria varia]
MVHSGLPFPSQKPHNPIANLDQTTDIDPASSIRAVVTLLWPYSSSTRSTSLLCAEPDFRLRKSKGQVRIQFKGAAGKSVAQSAVGIGDSIWLSLEGARWTDENMAAKTPGHSVEGELLFTRRLILKAERGGNNLADLDIDVLESPPSEGTPSSSLSEHTNQSPVRPVQSLDPGTWSSPAFIQHSAIPNSSLRGYDPFVEEDGFSPRKGRKRPKFARVSGEWRYTQDVTPSHSPEKTSSRLQLVQIEGDSGVPPGASSQPHSPSPLPMEQRSQTSQQQTEPDNTPSNLDEVSIGRPSQPCSPTPMVTERESIMLRQQLPLEDKLANRDGVKIEAVEEIPPKTSYETPSSKPLATEHEPTLLQDQPEPEDTLSNLSPQQTQSVKEALAETPSKPPTLQPLVTIPDSTTLHGASRTPIIERRPEVVNTQSEHDDTQPEAPQSPRLGPVKSPTLPLVSPFPTGNESQNYSSLFQQIATTPAVSSQEPSLDQFRSERSATETDKQYDGIDAGLDGAMLSKQPSHASSPPSKQPAHESITPPKQPPLESPTLSEQPPPESSTPSKLPLRTSLTPSKQPPLGSPTPSNQSPHGSAIPSAQPPRQSQTSSQQPKKERKVVIIDISDDDSDSSAPDRTGGDKVLTQREEADFKPSTRPIRHDAEGHRRILSVKEEASRPPSKSSVADPTSPDARSSRHLPDLPPTDDTSREAYDASSPLYSPRKHELQPLHMREKPSRAVIPDTYREPSPFTAENDHLQQRQSSKSPAFPARDLTPPPSERPPTDRSKETSVQVQHAPSPEESQLRNVYLVGDHEVDRDQPKSKHPVDQILDGRAPITPAATRSNMSELGIEQAHQEVEPPKSSQNRSKLSRGNDIADTMEVPDVISPWFSSRRSGRRKPSSHRESSAKGDVVVAQDGHRIEPPLELGIHEPQPQPTEASKPPRKEASLELGTQETTSQPMEASQDTQPEPSQSKEPYSKQAPTRVSTLPSQQQSLLKKGLRTPLSYYAPMRSLDTYVAASSSQGSVTVDLLSVITEPSSKPTRAKSGPKDHHTMMKVTDVSSYPDTIQVQCFRPFPRALPAGDAGDVILLRDFVVRSRDRRCYILSAAASAWFIWRFSKNDNAEMNVKTHVAGTAERGDISSQDAVEECTGPPVEVGRMERERASMLRSWWLSMRPADETTNGNK